MKHENVRCGLEIHAQLNFLNTKLFCECSTSFEKKKVNENTCPVCLGQPGSLPVINGSAVAMGIKLAKALHMQVPMSLSFSRKHYDYPDLPKGFQITQQSDGILGTNGYLFVKGKKYSIRQIQLEEDPAKLSYQEQNHVTIVDYNRCGITLIETVTDPIFHHPDEIKDFLRQFRRLLLYLQISNTRKEGALRADVNVSVGNHPRVEIKNIGSDSEIIRAFKYEVKRQGLITDCSNIGMETRHWDSESGETIISRGKEELYDYKYMKEGNIPTIEIISDFVSSITLPDLPWDLENQLYKQFDSLSNSQINTLLDNPKLLNFYEQLMTLPDVTSAVKDRFFWQVYLSFYNKIGEYKDESIQNRIRSISVSEVKMLLDFLSKGIISNKESKRLLRRYFIKNEKISSGLGFSLDSSDQYSIDAVIKFLKENFPKVWEESKKNQNKVNFLIGQGVKFSKGRVKAKELRDQIIKNL